MDLTHLDQQHHREMNVAAKRNKGVAPISIIRRTSGHHPSIQTSPSFWFLQDDPSTPHVHILFRVSHQNPAPFPVI